MAGEHRPVEFNVTFHGLDRLLREFEDRIKELIPAVEAALFIDAEQTITEAKKIVPVDEGILKASGHAQLPEIIDGVITVECGFGGPAGSGGPEQTKDVGYAVYVHEDLEAYHTVGQAKYLEVPFYARHRNFGARIARRVRRRMKLR